MNIGFDYRLGGLGFAGIGRYARELIFNILKIDKQNYYKIFFHPKTIAYDDKNILSRFDNVDLIPAPYKHYSFAEQTRFLKLLNDTKLNLVHFPHFNYPILYKRPFVVTIHDVIHHRISGKHWTRKAKFEVYKQVITRAAQNSEKIITISEVSKRDIMEYLKVPLSKIEVTYEGVSLAHKLPAQVEQVKKKYLIQKPYFIFVGRMEPRKNIPMLAQIFSDFLDKYKFDMELVIVGKEDIHHPEEKERALQIKHANKIIFTGFASDDDLGALYQGAYGFITTSFEEGFGLPGLEAIAMGIPVIAPDIPIYNEIYDNAALYYRTEDPEADMLDKMRFLCSDHKYYEELKMKTVKRAAEFSWYSCAAKTIKIYESTLK